MNILHKFAVQVFKKYQSKPYHRFVVLTIDCLLVLLALLFTILMRYMISNVSFCWGFLWRQSLLVLCVFLLSFLITQSYVGLVRFAGFGDMVRMAKASICALVILVATQVINIRLLDQAIFFHPSFNTIWIVVLMSFVMLCFFRFFVRRVYNESFRLKKVTTNVIIYGAGSAGQMTNQVLKQDGLRTFNVVCFVDDAKSKAGQFIDTIPIVRPGKAMTEAFLKKHEVEEMIIAIPSLSLQKRQVIMNQGLDLGLKVKMVPHLSDWIDNKINANQIEEIKIEDLLGREAIILDERGVKNDIEGKVVMVTGAAGSIGSEICRQIIRFKPSCLIMLDQAESPMYDLQFELTHQPFTYYNVPMEFVVANVKDYARMDSVMSHYKPNIIYHAAAYKHVPLMEMFPYEAVAVNVFGTKNIADLAIKYEVEKFVMVSTDKAVNPTNVMGATKRIAEIYTQSRHVPSTNFITTRFGNVLGSNGSVIPLFKKQLSMGGPLTVTDEKIIRYFMTIPEACCLVLEAGAIGVDGNIFVFDMGEPVKIYDLAKKMIALSHVPNVEIQITGLRPGEKLYEELLATKENTIPTGDPKIMRAKVREYDAKEVDAEFELLKNCLLSLDDNAIVAKMKDIVPEFISNNSTFEVLDKHEQ